MRSLSDHIQELQREVDLLEQVYTIAKLRESGQDKDWEIRKASLIRQICELVSKYKIGDDPHKAVGLCAHASALAMELRAPAYQVAQFQEKRQLLTMAYADEERRSEAQTHAEELYENQPWRQRSAVNL